MLVVSGAYLTEYVSWKLGSGAGDEGWECDDDCRATSEKDSNSSGGSTELGSSGKGAVSRSAKLLEPNGVCDSQNKTQSIERLVVPQGDYK